MAKKKKLIDKNDGIVARYINRKISIPISYFIVKHKIPITPNFMTLLSFLLGILSGILFGFGQVIGGGVLIQISSILDGCDGEIAKLRKSTTKLGHILDRVSDAAKKIPVIFGICFYEYLQIRSLLVLLFSYFFISYYLLRYLSYQLLIVYNKSLYNKCIKIQKKSKGFQKFFSFIRNLGIHRGDTLIFLVMIASFFNWQFKILLFENIYLVFYDAFFLFNLLLTKK